MVDLLVTLDPGRLSVPGSDLSAGRQPTAFGKRRTITPFFHKVCGIGPSYRRGTGIKARKDLFRTVISKGVVAALCLNSFFYFITTTVQREDVSAVSGRFSYLSDLKYQLKYGI